MKRIIPATSAASWQSLDVVADPEVDVEAGGRGAIHQVGDPTSLPAEVLAGVELGAVLGMRDQVVLGVFGDLGADLGVSCRSEIRIVSFNKAK